MTVGEFELLVVEVVDVVEVLVVAADTT